MSAPPTLADRVRNKQYVWYWIRYMFKKNMTEESQVSLIIINVGNIPDTIYQSFLPF